MRLIRKAAVALYLLVPAVVTAQVTGEQLIGKWRGEFTIRDGIKAPFNFEISPDGNVYLLNGTERFETGKYTIDKDSIFIPLDQFDNELALRSRKNKLSGVLRNQIHKGAPIPVSAEKGKTVRFFQKTAAAKNISGRYDLEFVFENGKKEKAVAIFEQNGDKLTGTFLKPSGDARFLEGIVDGNRFYLSSFIGSSPGYYEGSFTNDGKISGVQVGTRIKHKFEGRYDENARLDDPFTTSPVSNRVKIDFSFPDADGKMVSLEDEKYRDRVVIIAITGTWCPNCIDEAAFLSPWYKENRKRGVEIITIHYERQSDSAFVNKMMRRFRKRFDIQYDQVSGGIANADSVKKSLPALQTFSSFPTTIFVDKKGNISKIHTGYTGPATGKFYDEFVKEFNEEVDRLLKE